MISKHLMHLEKQLGTRLFNRSSRSSSLTESGKLFFERCKVFLEGMAEAELAVGSVTGVPRGTLRVSAPSWDPLDRRPSARRPRKGFDTSQLVASANSLRPNLLSSASP
jgi:DNA-binding transcriptional LysR family regulator